MRLFIEVLLGNAAMACPSEALRAIQNALDTSRRHEPMSAGDRGPIIDENGNKVRKWTVIE